MSMPMYTADRETGNTAYHLTMAPNPCDNQPCEFGSGPRKSGLPPIAAELPKANIP